MTVDERIMPLGGSPGIIQASGAKNEYGSEIAMRPALAAFG